MSQRSVDEIVVYADSVVFAAVQNAESSLSRFLKMTVASFSSFVVFVCRGGKDGF